MLSDPAYAVTLTCHPHTPNEAVRKITARLRWAPEGALAITYLVEGDIGRVRVPAPCAPRVADCLWQHTCCEIFIARKGMPAYHEFNFSPSGEWAQYAFDGYRVPRADGSGAAPNISVRATAITLELDAVIQADCLPVFLSSAPLSIALSAVIEDRGGALSYWALRHPPGKPDFHHPAGFALNLAAPTTPPTRAGAPPRAGGER
jgi:hypothetical protein